MPRGRLNYPKPELSKQLTVCALAVRRKNSIPIAAHTKRRKKEKKKEEACTNGPDLYL